MPNPACASTQLTVSLTRRANRREHHHRALSLEVLAAGGVLVEENSFDNRYFSEAGGPLRAPSKPGPDLSELIPFSARQSGNTGTGSPPGRLRMGAAPFLRGLVLGPGLLHRLYPA